MPEQIMNREFLLLSYYEELEHFEHDEALRRVAAKTGQAIETVEGIVAAEAVA